MATVVTRVAPHALLAGLVALTGCESSVAVDLAVHSSPIINGTPTTGDPGVVALVRSGGSTAFCTGTVIAPRLVMTAAHCADPSSAAEIQVFFGADLAQPGTFIDIEHVEVAPGFDRSSLTNDIALLVLAVPSPAPAWPLWSQPFDPSFVGLGLRIVGFGSTGDGMSTFMVKYEGSSNIAEYAETTFLFHPEPSQTCAGDSGGPGFATIGGIEYLIGVTRSGDPGCMEFARHTRVDPYVADFIAPFVAASEEGAAQVSDRCYYVANCTSGLCAQAPDDERIRYCTRACQDSADCPLGMTCAEAAEGGLQCQLPTPTPGALGSVCDVDAQCADRTCARVDADQPRQCSVPCSDPSSPGGRLCGFDQLCAPSVDDPERFLCIEPTVYDNGCASGPGSSSIGGSLALLFLLLRPRARARRPRAT